MVGSEAEVRRPKLGPEVWQVTAMEAGRGFEWRSQNPAFTTISTYRIEPLGADRSRVVLGLRQKRERHPMGRQARPRHVIKQAGKPMRSRH